MYGNREALKRMAPSVRACSCLVVNNKEEERKMAFELFQSDLKLTETSNLSFFWLK